ncbi:MAG: hypothetical protein ACJ8FO_02985 [Sphingomicrobium sp.]
MDPPLPIEARAGAPIDVAPGVGVGVGVGMGVTGGGGIEAIPPLPPPPPPQADKLTARAIDDAMVKFRLSAMTNLLLFPMCRELRNCLEYEDKSGIISYGRKTIFR